MNKLSFQQYTFTLLVPLVLARSVTLCASAKETEMSDKTTAWCQPYSTEEKATYYWLRDKLIAKLELQNDYNLLESEMLQPRYKGSLFVYNFDVEKDGTVRNLRRYGHPPQHNSAEQLIEKLIRNAAPFDPPPNDLTCKRGITLDFKYDGELITSV